MDIPALFDASSSTKVILAAVLFGILAREARARLSPSVSAHANDHPLPPGPKPDPIVGNLFLIPNDYQWKIFADWGKRWGVYHERDNLIDVSDWT